MNWPWRVIIIVPSASKVAAEQAARAINSTGPDYESDAFTLPLSASGDGSPTHWALYTSATDAMVAAMASAMPQIGGAQFWRHDQAASLVASNVTQSSGQAWGFAQSLESAGLRRIADAATVIPLPTPIPEGDTFPVLPSLPRFRR
jgi:hypothetical protein